MTYRRYGLTWLHELFQDFIVYRNLAPADSRLPAIADLRQQLGLPDHTLPRKAEPEYGAVVAAMLNCARRLSAPGIEVERVLFIGDTRLNDGTAFQNMCMAGGWPGWCFIGRDDLKVPPQANVEGPFYIANRWSALPAFLQFVHEQGFALDSGTAVVIDMDKTLVGARGRNDRSIDEARVEGIRRTVADLLGSDFDQAAFQTAYDELNQPAYHSFTADNQDYLAYICLILGAGLFTPGGVIQDVRAGRLANFREFISCVQGRREELAASGLMPVHDEVWRCVQADDPTPFKAFRYNEYLTTAARFGDLPGATVDQVLKQRIVITQEVREAALMLREKGALLFALSDKPDEASMPNARQLQDGMRPLHGLETVVVGDDQTNGKVKM